MSNQVMKHCKVCGADTLHIQPSTSHLLHLVLSILTAGFWIIIWLLVAQNNASQAQCSQCGSTRGLFGSTRPGNARQSATGAPTPETHVKCPDCAELVRREARVCKHCGCRLVPQ